MWLKLMWAQQWMTSWRPEPMQVCMLDWTFNPNEGEEMTDEFFKVTLSTHAHSTPCAQVAQTRKEHDMLICDIIAAMVALRMLCHGGTASMRSMVLQECQGCLGQCNS